MIPKKIAFLIGIVAFIGATYISFNMFSTGGTTMFRSPLSNYKPPTNGATGQEVDNAPKTEECPMNGQLFSKNQKSKWEARRPLGVAVENSKDARPQSGLSNADVVYEVVAEGGITRFLGIYYCQDANPVGPVRSARIYFLNLLRGYGAYPLYAHVGGANCDSTTGSGCANGAPADALGTINELGWSSYNDLNQFNVPFPNYWRDPERLPNVATEHTVYTSTEKLWTFAKSRKLTQLDEEGEKWNEDFTPWEFTDAASADKRGSVGKISFGFWDNNLSDFSVTWTYSKTTNDYSRTNGGKPHLDKNTGKALSATNIVIVMADESPANDGYEGGHLLYDIIGSGDSIVFQNGKAIKGTWKKADEESMMRFYDAAGEEVQFVRGQIFVEVVPTGNKITY